MRLGVTMQAQASSSSSVASPDFGSRRHRRPSQSSCCPSSSSSSLPLPALSGPHVAGCVFLLSLPCRRRNRPGIRAAAGAGSGGNSKPPASSLSTSSSSSTSPSSTSRELPPAPVRLSSTSAGYPPPTSFKADPYRPGRPVPVSQELLDACEKLGMPHPKTWLFDPATGLALIRKKLTYAELLRDVRLGRVRTVALFDPEHAVYDAADVDMYGAYGKTPPGSDGAAIVQYREGFRFGDEAASDRRVVSEDDPALVADPQVTNELYPAGGVVATANVPPYDARLAAAFEAHGVSVERLPCPGDRTAFFLQETTAAGPSPLRARFYQALPYLLLAATYGAAQFGAWLKGDLEDRNLMRKADVAREKAEAAQLRRDEARLELEQLAAAGYSAEAILGEARRVGRPAKEAYVRALVEAFVEGAGKEFSAPPAGGAGAAAPSQEKKKKRKDPFEGDPDAYAEALRKAALAKLAKMQGGSDSAEAQEAAIGRLSTVQVQKASAAEAGGGGSPADAEVWDDDATGAALRQAQRKLKGVKLQYVGAGKVLFGDVAGVEGAKRELAEVVDFFTKPERFRASGAKVPRGVLLFGPPGTGKTLLARAVAGEAGVSFLSLNASEFVEMFVGVGASRVRDLFAQARAMAPAVIFIDEIDAVGRKRSGGTQGNDERDATLNQLLTEMDGFTTEQDVVVIGATNRADVLDEALLRPGRFDRIATVQEADAEGRAAILRLHLGWEEGEGGSRRADGKGPEEFALDERGRPTGERNPRHRRCDESVDLERLAEDTHGFSGAALAALVNDAALRAARDRREAISMADLEEALEEELMGAPAAPYAAGDARGPRLALVEASAAVAAVLLSPPLERLAEVTIRPRDKWPYGQTVLEADGERERAALFTRSYLLAQLVAALLPYAAERLFRGPSQQSMLASRRLATGRRIVDRMVAGAGIGGAAQGGPGRDFLSVVSRRSASAFSAPPESSEPSSRLMGGEWRTVAIPAWFGGRGLAQVVPSRVSRGTHAAAAADAQALFEEGLAAAEALAFRNRGAIEAVARALLERQTLRGSEVRRIVEAEGDAEDVARCKREKGMFY